MYIVKVYGKNQKLLDDGYREVPTLVEATAIRKDFITNYPFGIGVKVFEATEVRFDDDLIEQSKVEKRKKYEKLIASKKEGIDFDLEEMNPYEE